MCSKNTEKSLELTEHDGNKWNTDLHVKNRRRKKLKNPVNRPHSALNRVQLKTFTYSLQKINIKYFHGISPFWYVGPVMNLHLVQGGPCLRPMSAEILSAQLKYVPAVTSMSRNIGYRSHEFGKKYQKGQTWV